MPSVRDVIGFSPGPKSRERFDYVVQRPPARTHKKANYLSRREVDARLAPYLADLRAGAPDAWVAKRAGLTERQVKSARHREDIMRKAGRQPTWRRWLAVSALGTEPVPMPTASAVGGSWEIPQYLMRQGLDYQRLVRVVTAAVEAGMSPDAVAAGLGLRPRDVRHAAALGDRL